MTCESELWAWNGAEQCKIQADVEMSFLRGASGRKRLDRAGYNVFESFGMAAKAEWVNRGVVEWVNRIIWRCRKNARWETDKNRLLDQCDRCVG